MKQTNQSDAPSLDIKKNTVEEIVAFYEKQGLESMNLGIICFHFLPPLKDMNLYSVVQKVGRMVKEKETFTIENFEHKGFLFHFYANLIQYLINREIRFEIYAMKGEKGDGFFARRAKKKLHRDLSLYQKYYKETRM